MEKCFPGMKNLFLFVICGRSICRTVGPKTGEKSGEILHMKLQVKSHFGCETNFTTFFTGFRSYGSTNDTTAKYK